MLFKYSTVGRVRDNSSKLFQKDTRVQIHYEIETDKILTYKERISLEERETVISVDVRGTHVYSCDKVFVHKLIKRVIKQGYNGWTIIRIGTFEGKPVEIEMTHADQKASVRI